METGFQLATFQAPLCAEPVEGMEYFIEQVEINTKGLEEEIGKLQTIKYVIARLKPIILEKKQLDS